MAVAGHAEGAGRTALPAWSLPKDAVDQITLPDDWPERITRDWALGGATGKGVRVCILDSGIDGSHPLVGELESSVVISIGENDEIVAEPDTEGDVSGHGTACAGIVRRLAPEASISSVRVLGSTFTGSGAVLLAGLRYAIEQGFSVINMSLSTTKKPFASVLHELADSAYFKRTVLVASAHNMPVESYPWRFSSVISVGSHEEARSARLLLQPESASRVLRSRCERRGPLARRAHARRLREQLRNAAHHLDLRLGPLEAPGADALPAQERPLSDRDERWGWEMTEKPDLRAAVAAGVVGSEESFHALLSAIVEVARSIFGAKASSILLLDMETEELVFEAVVGEGEDTLLGTRFPAGTGIAGWVLATRTPLVIEDVHSDPRWSRDVAEGTGYVPKGLMAAPLLHEEGALGVLSVLDRPEQTLFSLQEMELLGLFANQAAIAVDLLLKARKAEVLLADGGGELDVVARLARAVDALEDERRDAGFRLLRELEATLGAEA